MSDEEEGEDSNSSNASEESSDNDKCFRSRMTHPVVWFPRHMRAGNGEGEDLDDASCPLASFEVIIKVEFTEYLYK